MSPSRVECGSNCGMQSVLVWWIRRDEEDQINKVLDPRVRSIVPRERVGMELLGELLGLGNRQRFGWWNPGEGKKVLSDEFFGCRDGGIAESNVDMESRKRSSCKKCIDWKASATTRRTLKLGARTTNLKDEVIAEVILCGGLQFIANVSQPGGQLAFGTFDGEINVLGRACLRSITKLHCVASLEKPRRCRSGKESSEKSFDDQLQAERRERDTALRGSLLQSMFEGDAKVCGGFESLCHWPDYVAASSDAESRFA